MHGPLDGLGPLAARRGLFVDGLEGFEGLWTDSSLNVEVPSGFVAEERTLNGVGPKDWIEDGLVQKD